MKERERAVASGLTIFLVILWLGFLLHRSPRFAGSAWGGVLGVSGAVIMLVPLSYMVVKRFGRLRKWATQYVSMRTLLAWHIYAGIVGPILVLLHTGHKFESPLGIALTAMTLVVVISGFVGRYLMKQFSTEIRDKKAMLGDLKECYREAVSELRRNPDRASLLRPFSGFFGRAVASLFVRDAVTKAPEPSTIAATSPSTLLRVSESIADLEYAVKTHEAFKRWFGKWLKFHIVMSIVLYGLMALHIWAAIHFGLRWFEPTASSHVNSDSQQEAVPWINRRSPFVMTAEAVDEFNSSLARLFHATWRPPEKINGISTTVFDYSEWARQVKQPESDFSKAVVALKRVYPSVLGGGNSEKAFWINAYNFTAMKLAAENYPVDSITSRSISLIKNPWGMKAITIGEREYTMRQIEEEELLEKFGDSRIVFAVSCAAVSCPDRTAEIFAAERIDSQLDGMIRTLFENPDKGLRIDRGANTLTISWIVQADQRLFGEEDGTGVLDFVSRYVAAEVVEWMRVNRATIQIKYFEHDWGLNDTALADKRPDADSGEGR